MKTEIMYATTCKLTIHFNEGSFSSAEWADEFRSLQTAIDAAHDILELYNACEVIVWDANTGEILAQCTSDPEEDDDNYDEWDDGDCWDLECGFDPYLGCYTDDC